MSEPIIRPAVARDRQAIAEFTTATFSWGDYVADAFESWLADPRAHVAVAAVRTQPVAIARAVMMSANEGWLHGARVHPDHRRQGLGSRLNEHLSDWIRSQGGLVVRLMIESWNTPAQSQVASLGYRRVCDWTNGVRALGTEPDPATNGGRRVHGDEQLVVGTPAEIEPAWVAWSASELSRAGRMLFPRGWLMRRMTRTDLGDAVAAHRLLHGPSGWIVAEVEDDTTMFVPFLVAASDDAYRLVRAMVDRADRKAFERVRVLVPTIDWMEEALVRGGFEVSGDQIWERSLV